MRTEKNDSASVCKVSKVVFDSNARERARHTHQKYVLHWQKRQRSKRNMLSQTGINNSNDQHHHQGIVVGDIILHLESKPVILQVIIQSQPTAPSVALDTPNVYRLPLNSSGISSLQTVVPCDLKNDLPAKVNRERTKMSLSAKTLMNVQKAGWAMVKELKSKVASSNHSEHKTLNAVINTDSETTNF